MKQQIMDGLYMKEKVSIDNGTKDPKALSIYIWDYVMILLGSWTVLSMLISALNMKIDFYRIYPILFIYSLTVFILYMIPKYFTIKLFFLIGIYGVSFYLYFPKIKNGFYIVENLVISAIKSYYGQQYRYYVADYSDMVGDLTIIATFIMIIIITMMTVSIVRGYIKYLSVLFLFLPLIINLVLGKVPSPIVTIIFILVFIYLEKKIAKSHLSYMKIHQKVALWLCGLVLIICGFIWLLVSPEEYQSIDRIEDLKATVQAPFYEVTLEEFIDNIKSTLSFIPGNQAVGGLAGGELGGVEAVVFNNTEQLTITAPYFSIQEGLYLKGYVGSVYTGNSWEQHKKQDRENYSKLFEDKEWNNFSPFDQIPNLLLIAENKPQANVLALQGQINIKYEHANKEFLYVPYFTDSKDSNNINVVDDLYIKPARRSKEYTWDYYFGIAYASLLSNNQQEGKVLEQEAGYRDFVYDVYTRLPEIGLVKLKSDFSKVGENNQFTNTSEYLRYVITYLHQNTSYSLTPGKLPEDKDFVEYFLYESKQGYCAHYASAATLMLRVMGIPARYVEGYAVDSIITKEERENKNTAMGSDSIYPYDLTRLERKVRDYNAHAWVEIYLDGAGWIPVEVTPGSYREGNEEIEEALEQEESTIPDQGEPTSTPTPIPTPKEEKPTVPLTPTPTQSAILGQESQSEDNVHKVVIISIVLICILSVIAGVYYIYRWNKLRKLVTRGQKALYIYNRVEAIVKLCNGIPEGEKHLEEHGAYAFKKVGGIAKEEYDALIEIAQKSRFNGGDLTPEELMKMERFYKSIRLEAISNETLIKGLIIRGRLLF